MKYAKGIGAGVLVALALYGGLQASRGVRNLYDDWAFVRQARIENLQRIAQQQRQAQQARPAPPAAPAPTPSQ